MASQNKRSMLDRTLRTSALLQHLKHVEGPLARRARAGGY